MRRDTVRRAANLPRSTRRARRAAPVTFFDLARPMVIVLVIVVSLLIGLFPTLPFPTAKRALPPVATPIPLQDDSISALNALLIPNATGGAGTSIVFASPSAMGPIATPTGTGTSNGLVASAPMRTGREATGGTATDTVPRGTASALPERTPVPTTPGTTIVPGSTVPMPLLMPTQQVARAEATLRTGAIDVIISYDGTDQTTSSLRFDLNPPQRFEALTTYRGATGPHTVETIEIGDRSWHRAGTASWIAGTPDETLAALVQAFLPRIATATDVATEMRGALTALSWYDPDRNADMRLDLDITTGTPRQLVQRSRGDATLVTVLYRGWNTAVSIAPPQPSDATAPAGQ